jgi:hypothetical protein
MATGRNKEKPPPRDIGRLGQPDERLLARVGIPLVTSIPGRRLWLSWQFAEEYTSEGQESLARLLAGTAMVTCQTLMCIGIQELLSGARSSCTVTS